jgi:hypothetical protein
MPDPNTPPTPPRVWDELRDTIVARAAAVGYYGPPDMRAAYVRSAVTEAVICCRAVLEDPESLIEEALRRAKEGR